MSAEIEIRPLRKDDLRDTFDCGQPELNRFLQHYAGQNQFKLHLAVTYVAVFAQTNQPRQKILGFATVASASIARQDMPSPSQRARWPQYPLPVLRLARLGVDKSAQGLGLGANLLRHVLRLALQQQDQTGCVAVSVMPRPMRKNFTRVMVLK